MSEMPLKTVFYSFHMYGMKSKDPPCFLNGNFAEKYFKSPMRLFVSFGMKEILLKRRSNSHKMYSIIFLMKNWELWGNIEKTGTFFFKSNASKTMFSSLYKLGH